MRNEKEPHIYIFPDPPLIQYDVDGTSKSGRRCRICGERISDHTQKIFGRWVCNLAKLDNGHWIHASRIYEKELEGHKVVERLIEDV